jgi:uncharacterized protein YndB with AHSA1/START domain
MSDLGTMEERGDHVVLRYERRLAHPVERVWAALTHPDELIGWWGRVEAPRLAAGEPYTITWCNEEDGESVVMEATITAIDPPALLEIEGEPHGRLRFELRADGDATELLLQCTSRIPPEHRTSVAAGWHFHLDALARMLGGGETDLVDVRPAWAPIHDRYVAAVG